MGTNAIQTDLSGEAEKSFSQKILSRNDGGNNSFANPTESRMEGEGLS